MGKQQSFAVIGSSHALSEHGGIAVTQESISEVESFDMTVDASAERTVVRLRGRLGIDSSPTLRDRLLAILQEQPPKTVIVDLTEVSFIDASGVATLIEGLKVARSRQSTFCLRGLQGRIVRLFEVTGLLGLFETPACKAALQEVN